MIFTDWYLPAYKAGGPVQSVYNLSCLLSKEFTVKVVCRDRDLHSDSAFPGIETSVWTKLGEEHYVMYLSPPETGVSFIKQLIKENKDNIIYINGLYSFKFSVIPALLALYLPLTKYFISVRGMLHASALSVKPMKKQIFLAFARGFGLYRRATLLASDEKEVMEIRNAIGKVQVEIAPNIPLLPFEILPRSNAFKLENKSVKFLFIGRIAPEKNPLALLYALQSIDLPCSITFVGAESNNEYSSEFNKKLKELPMHIEAKYIGDIPHAEIPALLMVHDVMVLPSLGENFGHAIFESFAYGLPVVIGNNTPWSGIEQKKAGLELNPKNIAEITAALLWFIKMDADEYAIWSRSARQTAIDYFEANNFRDIYVKLFS